LLGTYHEDDQPSHLKIKPELENIPREVSMQVFAAPEIRFCPAGVYEYVNEGDKDKLVINAQVRHVLKSFILCFGFRELILNPFFVNSLPTRRIAFIVNAAASKCPMNTFNGLFPREVAAHSTK
jgi:hypothetical protein